MSRLRYKWVILLVNFLLIAVSFAGLSTWSVAVPFLQTTLHVSSVMVQLGAAALILGYALGSFAQAEIAARIGLKKTGMLALVFLVGPQFLIPFVQDYNAILVLRFTQGWGIIWFVTMSLATGWFPGAQRGMATGVVTAAVPFGIGAGGIAVGAVLHAVRNWQAMFISFGIFTLVVVIAWMVLARDPPNDPPKSALVRGPRINPYTLAAGWLVAACNFCIAFQSIGLYAILPAYLYHLGYGSLAAGNALLVAGLSGAVSSPLGGLLSDAWIRHGKPPLQSHAYVMSLAGFLVAAIGTFLLPFTAPLGYGAILIGTVVALWNAGGSLIGALPADMLGDRATAGRLFGLVIVIGLPGGAVSPYVGAALASRAGWTAPFALLGTAAACGVILGLSAPRFSHQRQSPPRA